MPRLGCVRRMGWTSAPSALRLRTPLDGVRNQNQDSEKNSQEKFPQCDLIVATLKVENRQNSPRRPGRGCRKQGILHHLTAIVLASWAWQIPDELDHDRGGRGNHRECCAPSMQLGRAACRNSECSIYRLNAPCAWHGIINAMMVLVILAWHFSQ